MEKLPTNIQSKHWPCFLNLLPRSLEHAIEENQEGENKDKKEEDKS